jgi:dihydrofolate synthase / folylpolyglutamate synthase
MNYQESLDFLFSQLPMYQRVGGAAYKTNLSATIELLDHLGNPQKKFKAIHIAGTNGKGSVAHIISSVLQTAGYKTALYTSPHLNDFRERIKINGEVISEDSVVDFVEKNKIYFKEKQLSFFEMTVGMAFQYFAESQIDIAVIEVGMGGRLDSTNLVQSVLSIITNIGLDHTQFLGETIEKIAEEKAGIIKKNQTVVVGERQKETTNVFSNKVQQCESKLVFAEDSYGFIEKIENEKNSQFLFKKEEKEYSFCSDLKGNYQYENIRTAIVALDEIQTLGFEISSQEIKEGLKNVISNTDLKGRWQFIHRSPLCICDTAHNVDGLRYVISQLKEIKQGKLHVVLGFVNDKNIQKLLSLFPKSARYYFCQAKIPRALAIEKLIQEAKKAKLQGQCYASVEIAYKTALSNASKKDVVFVGGSTFVVAEVL